MEDLLFLYAQKSFWHIGNSKYAKEMKITKYLS